MCVEMKAFSDWMGRALWKFYEDHQNFDSELRNLNYLGLYSVLFVLSFSGG